MDTLLTLREAASRLHVCERTVRRYVREGLLAALRVPGKRRLYVREADLAMLVRPEPVSRSDDVAATVVRVLG